MVFKNNPCPSLFRFFAKKSIISIIWKSNDNLLCIIKILTLWFFVYITFQTPFRFTFVFLSLNLSSKLFSGVQRFSYVLSNQLSCSFSQRKNTPILLKHGNIKTKKWNKFLKGVRAITACFLMIFHTGTGGTQIFTLQSISIIAI